MAKNIGRQKRHGITDFENAKIPYIKRVSFHNAVLTVYSIGWLSILSGMATVTLRLWQRKNGFPSPYFVIRGTRYYTALELTAYSKLIRTPTPGNDRRVTTNKCKEWELKFRAAMDSATEESMSKWGPEYRQLPEEEDLKKSLRETKRSRLKEEHDRLKDKLGFDAEDKLY